MTAFDLLNALSMLELPDGVIAFPTETVYGLGCHLEKPSAIEKIHHLTGSERTQPLVLLGQDWEHLIPYVDCQSPLTMMKARALMEAHWPGPLTLVLPKSDKVPEGVSPGLSTIGLRVPDCTLLQDLLALTATGVLATTRAQAQGGSPCTTAACIQQAFGSTVAHVLSDDFAVQDKVPSTVVAIEADGTLQVLRTGRLVIH